MIEVTGTKNQDIEASRIDKTIRYVSHPVKPESIKGLNKYGLVIMNNDNKNTFDKRDKNPFSSETNVAYGKANKVSMITTVELLKGFMRVKKNAITLDEFYNKLLEGGVLKFK